MGCKDCAPFTGICSFCRNRFHGAFELTSWRCNYICPFGPSCIVFFMAQVEVKKAFDTVAEVVDARLDQAVRQATQRLELLMKKLDAAAKPQARVCLKMGTPNPNGLSSLIVNIRIKASHSCVSPFSDPQIFDQFHSVRFPHGWRDISQLIWSLKDQFP